MRVKEGRVGEETEKLMQRGWNLKEFTLCDSSLPEADEVTGWVQLRPMHVWGLQEVETLEQGLWEMQQGASQSSSETPEESKHPPGSFPGPLLTPRVGKMRGRLGHGQGADSKERWVQHSHLAERKHTLVSGMRGQKRRKLAFVSTELCHVLRWPAFWLLTWGFPAMFLLLSH